MTSLVLFGAGASYGQSSPDTPPLGAHLFMHLRARGGEWGAADLQEKFGDKDFEQAMRALLDQEAATAMPPGKKRFVWRSNSPQARSVKLQWEMAAFFYQLALAPDAPYERFVRRAEEALRGGRVRIATLNYERLLFQALERASIPFLLTGDDLLPTRICLPHGSCDLAAPAALRTDGRVEVSESFGEFNPTNGGIFASGGPVSRFSGADSFNAARSDNHLPPVMSFIEPTKASLTALNYIIAEQQRWANWVAAAKRIALVGVRVHAVDSHIWEPLEAASADLLYVGGSGAVEFNKWQKERRQVPGRDAPCRLWADAFDDVLSFVLERD